MMPEISITCMTHIALSSQRWVIHKFHPQGNPNQLAEMAALMREQTTRIQQLEWNMERMRGDVVSDIIDIRGARTTMRPDTTRITVVVQRTDGGMIPNARILKTIGGNLK